MLRLEKNSTKAQVAVTPIMILALLIVPMALVSTARAGTNTSTEKWIQTNGPYGGLINCFAVSGTNLFAGTGDGVFLSTDNGTSWTAVNNGLTDTYISALAVGDTNLFAGTIGGDVFLSANNGTSWTDVRHFAEIVYM